VICVLAITTSLKETKATPQMKDVGDFSARVATLELASVGTMWEIGRLMRIQQNPASDTIGNITALKM
jgi:hypothetical protein